MTRLFIPGAKCRISAQPCAKNRRPAQNTTGAASRSSSVIQPRSPSKAAMPPPRPGAMRPMAIATRGTVSAAASATLRFSPAISASRAVRSRSPVAASPADSGCGSYPAARIVSAMSFAPTASGRKDMAARSVARLTLASRTPDIDRNLRSTRLEQLAQVMPPTPISSRSATGRYPAVSTCSKSAAIAGPSSSTTTLAFSVARLTLTLATPGMRFITRSTRAEQFAQVIPSTRKAN